MRHVALGLMAIAMFAVDTARAQMLSPQGYGPVKFGASLKNVEAAVGQSATPKDRELGCAFVTLRKFPSLKFMVEDGVITRADALRTVKNTAGIRLGMSLAEVKRRHPNVRVEPHHYTDDGHYLILSTSDEHAAIVLEEAAGRVTDLRAGLQPSVGYVEGCL